MPWIFIALALFGCLAALRGFAMAILAFAAASMVIAGFVVFGGVPPAAISMVMVGALLLTAFGFWG